MVMTLCKFSNVPSQTLNKNIQDVDGKIVKKETEQESESFQ